MATTKPVAVEHLSLDLGNYRAVPQKSEAASLQAIISVDPEYFWGLLDSLLSDGYLPTENIIVLKRGDKLVVREGNRRVGAMKLALGLLKGPKIDLPPELDSRLNALDEKWKQTNKDVPCTIYPASQAKKVDEIVTMIHGKGQKAGRLPWTAVARARHNRDELHKSEPALDLLERYLREGRNVTVSQKDRWAGDYPITVLEDAIKRLGSAYGTSARDVADMYPANHREAFEAMMQDIGLKQLKFEDVRGSDFASRYGMPPAITQRTRQSKANAQDGAGRRETEQDGHAKRPSASPSKRSMGEVERRREISVGTTDPRSIRRQLKDLAPRGKRREKLVDLLHEARQLDIKKTPLAFCFVLRSMFEISAKAYCQDHAANDGPAATKNGQDRPLVNVLRDVSRHLTDNGADQAMQKRLHGAMTELANSNGILSVTSMNQLIHNPSFTVDASHIGRVFSNVFPLLYEMNS